MNEDARIFLKKLSDAFKNASTTHVNGSGDCYVMTKELRDDLIKQIDELLVR